MPLYEYRCDKCTKVFEVIQKFSDEPLKNCETCGSPVEKLMSRTSFQLKGTGWYASDYKKSPASSAVTSATTNEPKTTATSETKPEVKSGGCSAGAGSCKKVDSTVN